MAVPEVVAVIKGQCLERRRRFVALPVHPVLAQVRRVAEHVRVLRLVRERVRAAADEEHQAAIVRVWETPSRCLTSPCTGAGVP